MTPYKWALRTFAAVYRSNSHTIRVRPAFRATGNKLVSIPDLESFLETQKDLLALEDLIDREDRGVVKYFYLRLNKIPTKFVSKRIRRNKVSSIFHEAFIYDLLKKQGMNVPTVVGICKGRRTASDYMLLKYIPNSRSLYEIYRKPERLMSLLTNVTGRKFNQNQIENCLQQVAKDFGVAVHRLFLTGILHSELDLKNVCLSVTPKFELFFLDFERTKTSVKKPTCKRIRATFKDSIPRRLARYNLSEEIKQAFADGYVSVNPEVHCADIHTCIRDLRRKSQESHFVVGIDGFAGSGKSTLARYLALHCDRAVVIETDMFMAYSRVERERQLEILQDHQKWYDTKRLGSLLAGIRKSKSSYREVIQQAYDHRSGQKSATLEVRLQRGSVVIIEGMYALSAIVRQHCSISILLTADVDTLFNRTYRRDTLQRKIPAEMIQERFRLINRGSYERFLNSNRTHADITIDTSDRAIYTRLRYSLLPYFLNC
jgi:uridine kinase/tRNA A-37 threonylcarbamoyl transferase component Bud32